MDQTRLTHPAKPKPWGNGADRCGTCGKVLKGKQTKWCSFRCLDRKRGRNRTLLRRMASFGVSLDDLKRVSRAQNGKCAICQRQEIEVMDHDHATGKFRALLCYRCNGALGGYEIVIKQPGWGEFSARHDL